MFKDAMAMCEAIDLLKLTEWADRKKYVQETYNIIIDSEITDSFYNQDGSIYYPEIIKFLSVFCDYSSINKIVGYLTQSKLSVADVFKFSKDKFKTCSQQDEFAYNIFANALRYSKINLHNSLQNIFTFTDDDISKIYKKPNQPNKQVAVFRNIVGTYLSQIEEQQREGKIGYVKIFDETLDKMRQEKEIQGVKGF